MDPSWYLYLGIFITPFIQEDTAVIAAATLSVSDSRHFPVVFFVILLGFLYLMLGNTGLAIQLTLHLVRGNGQKMRRFWP